MDLFQPEANDVIYADGVEMYHVRPRVPKYLIDKHRTQMICSRP